MSRPESDRSADVVVVGSGAAGLTAAMYLRRAGISATVVEGDPFNADDMPGGQLMLTQTAHAIPGFPDGVSGAELMDAMRTQAEGDTIEFVSGLVGAVDMSNPERVVEVDGVEYRGRAVVLATGARPRLLGLDGEADLVGRGVSVCAICDGPLFTDQDVAVVGGGDTAYEEAALLAGYARSVTVLQRGPVADAIPELVRAVAAHDRVTVRPEVEVTGYVATESLRGLEISTGHGPETVEVTGVFLAIGRTPNTELFAPWVAIDSAGYIVTVDGPATALPGVFACGECQDSRYRQFATAVGSGCMAGMDAARWVHRALRESANAPTRPSRTC